MKVGLIGFGMAGQVFHAPMITAAGMQLAKVQTNDKGNRDYALHTYPGVEVVENSASILQDETIELVVIATPNEYHAPLAKEALLAGKNVVVDKPFTVTTSEADALIALAQSKQLLLSVFQNRRFDSDFLTVSKLLKNNTLGDIVEFESHYDRFRGQRKVGAWREEAVPGSGILYDLGAHLIDQALVLFGMPESLFADVRKQREGAGVDDYFCLKLYYPNRLIVTLGAGMLVAQPKPRFIVNGTGGSFVKYGLDVQEELLKKGIFPSADMDWGLEPKERWGTLVSYGSDEKAIEKVRSEPGDYRVFYQNIAAALKGDATLLVQPEQSRAVIRLIELAIQSNESRKVISI